MKKISQDEKYKNFARCDHEDVRWKSKYKLEEDCIIYLGRCHDCKISVKEVIMFHEPEYFYGEDCE